MRRCLACGPGVMGCAVSAVLFCSTELQILRNKLMHDLLLSACLPAVVPPPPQGQEPQNIDKEFLRLWFRANCDPYNDAVRGGWGRRGLAGWGVVLGAGTVSGPPEGWGGVGGRACS